MGTFYLHGFLYYIIQYYQTMSKFTIKLIACVAFIMLALALVYYVRKEIKGGETVVSEDVLVEKITAMGKLELIKYSMRDVLEKKELRTLLPDKRVLFVASGEVTGCLDLTKVLKEDVVSSGTDSITVFLPQPEICYVKLDHKKSKVYEVSGTWFPSDTKDMVEDIYKLAERKILENARQMDIMGKTRQNAVLIFKPFLENVTGKKVGVVFR